jgi:hypothetical protein
MIAALPQFPLLTLVPPLFPSNVVKLRIPPESVFKKQQVETLSAAGYGANRMAYLLSLNHSVKSKQQLLMVQITFQTVEELCYVKGFPQKRSCSVLWAVS